MKSNGMKALAAALAGASMLMLASVPASAAANSSASGIEPQSMYERRVATSYDVSLTTLAANGSGAPTSTLYRKKGDWSAACTTSLRPCAKPSRAFPDA